MEEVEVLRQFFASIFTDIQVSQISHTPEKLDGGREQSSSHCKRRASLKLHEWQNLACSEEQDIQKNKIMWQI